MLIGNTCDFTVLQSSSAFIQINTMNELQSESIQNHFFLCPIRKKLMKK